MSLPFGVPEAILVLAIATAGAAVQSAAGFGLALVSAPVLLLVHAPLVPGPLLASSLVLTGLMAHRDRAHIDLGGMATALLGRIGGTALAALFLVWASPDVFDLVFAAMVLAAVVLSLAGLRVRPTTGTTAVAGALAGLMGTISSIGGPPMALLYQGEGAARLRGTLAGFFVIGTLLSLAALAAVGRFGWVELGLSLFLVPPMALGFALSAPLRNRISDTSIRPLVLMLSTATALGVLARAW
ncbi:MAG: sulfite exporter TauE/SafE family protein [Proteobacteria bacterium]|nr:sulfite exporter TauE/SafE family protein [Pseudomonadota bacterium]